MIQKLYMYCYNTRNWSTLTATNWPTYYVSLI